MSKRNTLIIVGLALLLAILIFMGNRDNTMDTFSPAKTNKSDQPQSFDKTRLSIDDSNCIWVVVNKTRPLNPTNYVPSDLIVPNVPLRYNASYDEMKLRKEAADALQDMTSSAKSESINLKLASGYRSFNLQTSVYNNFVKTQGRAVADTQSARPGYSEHQTGLAADLEPVDRTCEIEDCFANTKEGIWLAANSYKFGYIVRYQPGKQSLVGYKYEPWHFRYVGRELAAELKKQNNPTLEEFFGLPPAPDYN
jgi:D-alanyl-D-alanine carboxypeptidase